MPPLKCRLSTGRKISIKASESPQATFKKKWRPRSGAIFHHAELENERGVRPFRKPLNVNLSS